VLALAEPLSFWGGVDPDTGLVTDRRHPQAGARVTGVVLLMPGGRGSSSASTVLAESLRTGAGPAAVLLGRMDPIVVLGALVAAELYGVACPVVLLDGEAFATVAEWPGARVDPDGTVRPWSRAES
jgi:hypothetical protein